jgi:hypothetical protein
MRVQNMRAQNMRAQNMRAGCPPYISQLKSDCYIIDKTFVAFPFGDTSKSP